MVLLLEREAVFALARRAVGGTGGNERGENRFERVVSKRLETRDLGLVQLVKPTNEVCRKPPSSIRILRQTRFMSLRVCKQAGAVETYQQPAIGPDRLRQGLV